MKKKHLSILSFIFFFLLGVALLYFTFRKQSIGTIWLELKQANYWWYLVVLVCTIICHISRAIRWKLLMQPISSKPIKTGNALGAIMIGYFVNMLTGKVGEIVRCLVVKATDDVPVKKNLGTVVTERAIDVLCLVSLTLFTVVLYYGQLKTFLIDDILFPLQDFFLSLSASFTYIKVAVLALVGILMLGVFYLLYRKLPKFKQFVIDIFQGVISIKDVENKWSFLAHTVLIWAMYHLMTYFWFFGFEGTSALGPGAALMIITIAGFGRSLPIPNHGMGAYHFLVVQVVLILGLTEAMGITLGTVIHAGQTLFYLIFGGLAILWFTLFKNQSVLKLFNTKP